VRFLDKDGLYSSVKPILDGLQISLQRKNKLTGKMESYPGAGLIVKDSPDWIDLEVEQYKVGKDTPYTEITVEDDDGRA
jgi:hypothetical protein